MPLFPSNKCLCSLPTFPITPGRVPVINTNTSLVHVTSIQSAAICSCSYTLNLRGKSCIYILLEARKPSNQYSRKLFCFYLLIVQKSEKVTAKWQTKVFNCFSCCFHNSFKVYKCARSIIDKKTKCTVCYNLQPITATASHNWWKGRGFTETFPSIYVLNFWAW